MTMPTFTMRALLEAGVHFGHHANRWNPKMEEYIFGVRNGVHIIDLQQTVPMLNTALKTIRDIVANGGRVLFVGTKRPAQAPIKEAARRSGQYYVNHRWLGGMMTNWQTISKSINRLRQLDDLLAVTVEGRTKKEILMLTRERDKLELALGGIKEMGGKPDAIFIVDTNKESIAIKEANNLNIPVFAIVDTNSDLDGIDFPIPGNDDAMRAIELYCNLVSESVLDGLQAEVASAAKHEKPVAKIPSKKEAKAKVESKDKDKNKDKSAKEDAKPKSDPSKEEGKKEDEKKSDSAEVTAEDIKKQANA